MHFACTMAIVAILCGFPIVGRAAPSPSRDAFGIIFGKPLNLPKCPVDKTRHHAMCVGELSDDKDLGAVKVTAVFDGDLISGMNAPDWMATYWFTVWVINGHVEAIQFYIATSRAQQAMLAIIDKFGPPTENGPRARWKFDDLQVAFTDNTVVRVSTPVFDVAFAKFLERRAATQQRF